MSTAAAPPLISVEAISKRFAVSSRSLIDVVRGRPPVAVQAVDAVSFTVARGETLGIVGESGCGKSTLARLLVRLFEADDGRLRFEGRDVQALSGEERRRYNRRVQMIFQDPYGSLNPRLRVGACLAEALSVHRIVEPARIPARVAELIELVHLPPDAAQRYPHEFSGGQRQRIGLARALAVEPACIIADEPVSALDVSVQAQIMNLLLDLQARLGLTLVFITHDLRLVRHIAHRLAVMYLGRIVEIGPAAAIFAAPRHPYTKALLAAVPQLDPAHRLDRPAVQGELPSPLAPPPGCTFHPRCPKAQDLCRHTAPGLAAGEGAWPVACHFADPGIPPDRLETGLAARHSEEQAL